jgi:hypothetical protein
MEVGNGSSLVQASAAEKSEVKIGVIFFSRMK